jgi:hypothetical protein
MSLQEEDSTSRVTTELSSGILGRITSFRSFQHLVNNVTLALRKTTSGQDESMISSSPLLIGEGLSDGRLIA